MNITKEYLEKQHKKHDKVVVYSPDNIPLNISKEFFVSRDGSGPRLEFDMDCADLALYCKHRGLSLNPTNND